MADRLVSIADGFWNVRGSFKIAGFIDIGTHTSLARLDSGGFVLLDAYTLTGTVLEEILALTNGGEAIKAIINLHPFHTIHVKKAAALFPHAKLYGSPRHVEKAPDLTWEPQRVESPEFQALFAEDFTFTVPRGVDYISDNENLHFSSVLAFHKATRTLHVDDTLMWVSLPLVGGLRFHLTLKQVLQPHPGAAAEFRAWAQELIQLCEGVEHLCTAHMRPLPPSKEGDGGVAGQVREALSKVESVLSAHEARHG